MHATLCRMVLDLIQNSIEAKASHIWVKWIEKKGVLQLRLKDDGCGMDSQTLAQAWNPWVSDLRKHPNRRVGLGLPFLAQTVETAKGRAALASKKGRGTRLSFTLNLNELDCPPVGNVGDLWVSALLFDGNYHLSIQQKRISETGQRLAYRLNRKKLIAQFGNLQTVENGLRLKRWVQSCETHKKE